MKGHTTNEVYRSGLTMKGAFTHAFSIPASD